MSVYSLNQYRGCVTVCYASSYRWYMCKQKQCCICPPIKVQVLNKSITAQILELTWWYYMELNQKCVIDVWLTVLFCTLNLQLSGHVGAPALHKCMINICVGVFVCAYVFQLSYFKGLCNIGYMLLFIMPVWHIVQSLTIWVNGNWRHTRQER